MCKVVISTLYRNINEGWHTLLFVGTYFELDLRPAGSFPPNFAILTRINTLTVMKRCEEKWVSYSEKHSSSPQGLGNCEAGHRVRALTVASGKPYFLNKIRAEL